MNVSVLPIGPEPILPMLHMVGLACVAMFGVLAGLIIWRTVEAGVRRERLTRRLGELLGVIVAAAGVGIWAVTLLDVDPQTAGWLAGGGAAGALLASLVLTFLDGRSLSRSGSPARATT
jgi:hypothetical protein